jgi:hypothetical protein
VTHNHEVAGSNPAPATIPKGQNMATMRAKLKVGSVTPYRDAEGATQSEQVTFHGVPKSGSYTADGTDEDNTFAKFSPSVMLQMTIANPALFGKLTPGDAFYVDFTPVP